MPEKELVLKTFPSGPLKARSKEVKEVSEAERSELSQMYAIMYAHKGIGLAANQVGILKRMLVADVGEGKISLINPKIVSISKESDLMREGCLSVPTIEVGVDRSIYVEISAVNEYNKVFTAKYSGLLARVIQHEIDHLNGKLIIDYLNPLSRYRASRKLKKLKQ